MRSTSRWSGVRLLLGRAEQPGDVAHLGRHAGRGHDRAATASSDRGAVEDHVQPVADPGRRRQRRDVLQHRLALARQRRLRDRERGSLDEAPSALTASPSASSRRSPGTTSAAGTRCSSPSRTTPAVAAAIRCSAATACSARASCTIAEHGIEHDDHRDHDRLVGHALGSLDRPRDDRDDHRAEQQVDQRVGELREELPPRGHDVAASSSFGPYRSSRIAASAEVSPRVRSVPSSAATAAASRRHGSFGLVTARQRSAGPVTRRWPRR